MWNHAVLLKMICNGMNKVCAFVIMHGMPRFLVPLHDFSVSSWQGSSGFPGFPGANGEKGARVRKHTVPVCVWMSPHHHIQAQRKVIPIKKLNMVTPGSEINVWEENKRCGKGRSSTEHPWAEKNDLWSHSFNSKKEFKVQFPLSAGSNEAP